MIFGGYTSRDGYKEFMKIRHSPTCDRENASQVAEIANGVYGAGTVNKITEIIKVDHHVSNRVIAQELNIDHKTVLNHLRKVGVKKEAPYMGGATPFNTKNT
ncbi:hypothetical protein TNCV_2726321 [Trichonephila clavipes]|nr:hypothetical protein TNCV_2726321 [Trichonephila clavipes]